MVEIMRGIFLAQGWGVVECSVPDVIILYILSSSLPLG